MPLPAATVLGLNELETMALRHLLGWLDSAVADGREITPDELAEEFTPAELETLAGIRLAFIRHESSAPA